MKGEKLDVLHLTLAFHVYRKISHVESERGAVPGRSSFSQYSPFPRRPSTRQQPPEEAESKYFRSPSRKTSRELSKISQDSRASIATSGLHQSIDEIMSSVRVNRSRKSTPAHYHPSSPIPSSIPGDDICDSSMNSEYGRTSLEVSTSSLAQFLRDLDNVQNRLQKTSTCSNASFSGSYFSSTEVDPKPFSSRSSRNSFMSAPISPDSVNRRRKNGVFQPGFSYVNFGYNPDEEDENERINKLMVPRQRFTEKKEEDFSKNNNNNNPNPSPKKR